MKIHQMIESKFLKKEDAGDGLLVTFKAVKQHNVGKDDQPEMKWCAEFVESKPLVLNSTNLALIEKALGSDDSDDWIGKKIVLFNDENVSFGGQVTGGIRVDINRTKKYHAKQGAAQPAPQPAPQKTAGQKLEEMEDDVPF